MKTTLKRMSTKITALKPDSQKAQLSVNNVSLLIAATGAILLVVTASEFTRSEPTPDFAKYEAGADRKTAFFSHFLPLIQEQNEQLLALRQEVLELREEKEQLSFFERQKALALAEQYDVADFSLEDSESWNLLVRRVDIVPPSLALAQAAKESAWGTSRFAQEGSNFYGHWCFEEGCGIVPAARNEGAVHEVAGFDSARESVEKYMHNLNHHPAYTELRSIRANLREQQQPITGLKVAKGLDSYSERGEVYIEELSSLIRFNELSRYDSAL